MKTNRAQEKAIKTRNKNIALIAGAGTGKTFVLTQRLYELLEENQKGKILAITFTEKAAEEMESRLIQRMVEKNKIIDKNNFHISTIHSFCGDLLKNNPTILNLDPDFTIIEEDEANFYLEKSFKLIYDEIKNKTEYNEIIREKEFFDYNQFPQEMINLYNQMRAANKSIDDLEEESKSSNTEDSKLEKEFIKLVNNEVTGNLRNLKDFISKNENWEEILINGKKEDRLNIYQGFLDKKCFGSREEIEKILYRIIALLENRENENRFLLEILKGLNENYKNFKEKNSFLDFDDLQEKTLELFENQEKKKEIQDSISQILVDEAQDINELQKTIFYELASKKEILDKNNLFIVGDPRQSIYGFRYADLQVFYEMIKDIENTAGIKINMNENYRSSSQIIEYINDIFEDIFHSMEKLIFSSNIKSQKIELISSEENNDKNDAINIANKIIELKNKGVEYKDMAILFRASTKTHIYEEALLEKNIPVNNLSSGKFWERQEVLDFYHSFNIIDNHNDKSYLAFLRSPYFNISDKKLASWANLPGNWHEKIVYSAMNNDETAKSVRKEINRLKELKQGSIIEIFENLRKRFENAYFYYDERERIFHNLDLLKEFIIKDNERYKGDLKRILWRWTNRTLYNQSEAERESTGVTITTIHKSKGLEKRVIFLAASDNRFNKRVDSIFYRINEGIFFKNSAYHKIGGEKEKEEILKEEERLLYVALTRAKEYLYLSRSNLRINGYLKILEEKNLLPKKSKILNLELKSENKGEKEIKFTNLYEFKSIEQQFPYSITQFNLYKSCPRHWYYRYELKLEEKKDEIIQYDGISGSVKGDFFHYMAENDIGEDINKFIKNTENFKNIKLNSKDRQDIKSWIQTIRKEYKNNNIRELNFDWNIEGYLWTGSIDMIEELNGEYIIYDYKTNTNNENLIDIYKDQIFFYSLAMEKIKGKLPKKAILWWIPGNEKIEVKLNKEELKKFYKEIIDFSKYISANKTITNFEKTENCKYCKYIDFCKK